MREIDLVELKREKLTIAVQNGLDMGWSLSETLEYLTIRGVAKEDLALVRREDLAVTSAIEVNEVLSRADEEVRRSEK
jgi:hypothetical protein